MPWLKNRIKWVAELVLLGFLLAGHQAVIRVSAQQPSVLSSGDWYKIGVTATGIYRIDATYFKTIGIDINTLQPHQIHLYGNGSGILPQANQAPRDSGLRPDAIWVETGSSGRPEAVYFYGEGPATIAYDPGSGHFTHQVNPYTDTTYYFLTILDTPGLRIETRDTGIPASPQVVDTFDHYWFYEKETANLLRSGREWWGDYLGTTPSLNFELDFPGLVPGSAGLLNFSAIASAQVPTRFAWQVEGGQIGEQTAGTVSTYRYDLKAQKAQGRFSFTTPAQEKLKVALTFDKGGQTGASAYLDYAALQVKRRLRPYETPTIYRFLPGTPENRVYEFAPADNGFIVWDITDPCLPIQAVLKQIENGNSWLIPGDPDDRTYIGFRKEQAIAPHPARKIPNQDIRSLPVPDLIIVTAGEWKEEADRLASFREDHDRLTVLTVTTEQVFNEFASGKPDVTAIRDLCKYFYDRDPSRLKYLLLFGDATYDFRNKGGALTAAQLQSTVPSYQSRESLHPVYTYVSDDYFGFLDNEAGQWDESSSGDHPLRIGIGRLPVKTRDEAARVTDKLIDYASASAMGKWRNRITFVADNGDNNIHQQHADSLARQVAGFFLANRLFTDEYPLTSTSLGSRAPAVNQEIRRKIDEGSLILNFTGHGDESGWTDEQILTLADMQAVRGYPNMPLLVTATCEFGRYDNPSVVSGAELMLLSPRGAAIGAMTTTRPVFSSTNFTINSAFYNALTPGKGRLGDIFRHTKNNSLAGSLNRNFVLLGDPSMKLASPEKKVRWASAPDTLRPFSKAVLEGEIVDPSGNSADGNFNGIAYVSVFDKPTRFQTLGATGQPAVYEEYRTKLFEGTVTVSGGRFTVSFMVPDEGSTVFQNVLTSVYAHTDDLLDDASGQLKTPLGPAGRPPEREDNPPVVTVYLNDPSFLAGQTVDPNPVLFAEVTDDTGLKFSGDGCGITAILNDTLELPVQNYYSAGLDTYLKAGVVMPLALQEEGEYRLTLKVCDVFGNSTEKGITFRIKSNPAMKIRTAIVFPNPFRDKVSYRIEHNKSGHDLDVQFRLFSRTGLLIYSDRQIHYGAGDVVESELPVSAEINPELQIYLYELTLRSLQDMSTQRISGKLIRQ